VLGIAAGIVAVLGHIPVHDLTDPLSGLSRLAGIVLYIAAAYTLRSQLESSPINIPLGGVMTFFFAVIYFQYHLQDFHWEESSAGPVSIAPVEGGLGLRGPMAPIVNSEAAAQPASVPPVSSETPT